MYVMFYFAFLTTWMQYLCCLSVTDKHNIVESHAYGKENDLVRHIFLKLTGVNSWHYRNKSTLKQIHIMN